MTRAEFARGMTRLAVACQRALDDAVLEVYGDAIGDRVDARTWEAFTLAAVASGRCRFFPTVAELLDALREHLGHRPLEVEAGAAYEAVLVAGTYTPNGGTSWDYRGVLDQCGRAAAEAFLAAGGHHAFSSTWDESKRRALFLRVYQHEARERPQGRLLPAHGDRPALPAAEGEPTLDEARTILQQIAGLADEAQP